MIKVTITRAGIAAIGKNGYREVGRIAIQDAAMQWFTSFLPLHFKRIAYRRYNYERRDKRTDRLKEARKPWPFGENTGKAIGEAAPLVFTGRSREKALSAPNIKAKAKNYEHYQAVCTINAPAFNFGAGKRIDMRDEVTRFTKQELASMQKIFGRSFNSELKKRGVKATRTRRIKVS